MIFLIEKYHKIQLNPLMSTLKTPSPIYTNLMEKVKEEIKKFQENKEQIEQIEKETERRKIQERTAKLEKHILSKIPNIKIIEKKILDTIKRKGSNYRVYLFKFSNSWWRGYPTLRGIDLNDIFYRINSSYQEIQFSYYSRYNVTNPQDYNVYVVAKFDPDDLDSSYEVEYEYYSETANESEYESIDSTESYSTESYSIESDTSESDTSESDTSESDSIDFWMHQMQSIVKKARRRQKRKNNK